MWGCSPRVPPHVLPPVFITCVFSTFLKLGKPVADEARFTPMPSMQILDRYYDAQPITKQAPAYSFPLAAARHAEKFTEESRFDYTPQFEVVHPAPVVYTFPCTAEGWPCSVTGSICSVTWDPYNLPSTNPPSNALSTRGLLFERNFHQPNRSLKTPKRDFWCIAFERFPFFLHFFAVLIFFLAVVSCPNQNITHDNQRMSLICVCLQV